MKIFVCVKHVPDSAATIVVKDKNQIDERITFLLNPYDEYAVTEAVKLKKLLDNQAEVIAVSLGTADAEKTLRSAMAMGADRGILITTEDRQDSIITARALKAAIEQDCNIEVKDDLYQYGDLSLIFTGRESIDMVGMQTMFRIGAYFNIPVINNVVKFTPFIEDGRLSKAEVESLAGEGRKNIYEISCPCVLGAGRGLNTPSYPTFPDVVKARKKDVKIVPLDDLIKNLIINSIKYLISDSKFDNPQKEQKNGAEIINLELFAEQRTPKRIDGEPLEAAKEIVRILKQKAKVI
ncbi:MAG: electron transfer flavoprotein subunit beta/FixA family protein [Desulfamplus sp.]|nr:electron transfer flavoprotein subunit beta/FixA family protein [Desulfamplus sp.]